MRFSRTVEYAETMLGAEVLRTAGYAKMLLRV